MSTYDDAGMERVAFAGRTTPSLMALPSGPSTPPDAPAWMDEGDTPERLAHARAIKAHPDCTECRSGKGILKPGPPHCRDHDRHCSAEACW